MSVADLVQTPKTARSAARAVALLILLVFLALGVTPWQQTAWGDGRVIA